MAKYEPQTAAEHFALQRTTNAAELVNAVAEAREKGAGLNRAANEKFYNSLALFSSGTIALSVTYLGYLKTLVRSIQHPKWLMASWFSLMTCAACSLFWSFVYGYYSHYCIGRQYAEAVRDKNQIESDEIVNLSRNVANLQTPAQLEAFRAPHRKAAGASDDNAKFLARRENFYMHFWRLLGRIAHVTFLLGLGLLLAFAVKNT